MRALVLFALEKNNIFRMQANTDKTLYYTLIHTHMYKHEVFRKIDRNYRT